MKNINITKNPAGKLTLELICFSAVIFIIAATFKYITKNYSPDNFTHYFPVPRDDLLLYISIVGGFFISTLFKVTGKSIKSLNDTILFLSASIILYQTYTVSDANIISKLERMISIETLAIFKATVLTCTFAKFFISSFEFISDKISEVQKGKEDKSQLIDNLIREITILETVKKIKQTKDS
ncbi:TPA: hypothetical protein ACQ3AP_005236 [Klebsiella pneumoniae]